MATRYRIRIVAAAAAVAVLPVGGRAAAGEEPVFDTPLGEAVVYCQEEGELADQSSVDTDSNPDNNGWTDYLVQDDGHSVLTNGRIGEEVPGASVAGFNCLADQLDLPDWVQTRMLMSGRNGLAGTGVIELDDYTIFWTLAEYPDASGVLIYDSSVGGGRR